jgi:hypothetical protein
LKILGLDTVPLGVVTETNPVRAPAGMPPKLTIVASSAHTLDG